jgi:hypothetical protein
MPKKSPKIEHQLLTVKEAATAYRLSPTVVRALCRLGKLKHVVRRGRGPTGQVTMICTRSAAAVLGVGS